MEGRLTYMNIFRFVILKVSNSLEIVRDQFQKVIRKLDLLTQCPLKVASMVVSKMAKPVVSQCSNLWKTTALQSHCEKQHPEHMRAVSHPLLIQRVFNWSTPCFLNQCWSYLIHFCRAVFSLSYIHWKLPWFPYSWPANRVSWRCAQDHDRKDERVTLSTLLMRFNFQAGLYFCRKNIKKSHFLHHLVFVEWMDLVSWMSYHQHYCFAIMQQLAIFICHIHITQWEIFHDSIFKKG